MKGSDGAQIMGTQTDDPGVHARKPRAFFLLEVAVVLAVLGLLALLLRPRFFPPGAATRETQLRMALRQWRTELLIYKAQHHGAPPGYPNGDTRQEPTPEAFLAQMTGFTTPTGITSPRRSQTACLGPYLAAVPIDPMNASSAVRIIDEAQSMTINPSGPEGWVYDPTTAVVAANVTAVDADGVAYFDY